MAEGVNLVFHNKIIDGTAMEWSLSSDLGVSVSRNVLIGSF